ncbi:g5155 [Coccomyxa elongata]
MSQVTIQCSQTGESHPQQLNEGLLDWESVKHAFQTEVVELEAFGTPPLYRRRDQTGLTRQSFQANDNIKVKVTKKELRSATLFVVFALLAFELGTGASIYALMETLLRMLADQQKALEEFKKTAEEQHNALLQELLGIKQLARSTLSPVAEAGLRMVVHMCIDEEPRARTMSRGGHQDMIAEAVALQHLSV